MPSPVSPSLLPLLNSSPSVLQVLPVPSQFAPIFPPFPGSLGVADERADEIMAALERDLGRAPGNEEVERSVIGWSDFSKMKLQVMECWKREVGDKRKEEGRLVSSASIFPCRSNNEGA